ncbi:MAG: molybdenum cofactor guanylyltransferase MobA [Pseudooceanicola sp.]
MKQPVGLILAGGQGRRMGGVDKAFVRLSGATLLSHVLDRIDPQVSRLAISANGDPTRFAAFGVPVLGDADTGAEITGAISGDTKDTAIRGDRGQGPLAGILSGLDWAASQGADTVVSVAVDTPFIPPDLVPRLLLASDGMRVPLALASGPVGGEVRIHPACGLWSVDLREDLRAALRQGVRRVGAWAEEMGARRAFFADGEVAFFNVNHPTDLAQAEDILRAP